MSRATSSTGSKRSPLWFGIILTIGLIHGLLYIGLVLPWWHYDEPGHFEYAWLIAERGHIPQTGEYDESMRRDLAVALEKNNYYEPRNYRLDLTSSEPVWIGVPQTGDKPLYYMVAALPLFFLKNIDLDLQNQAVRLVSLFMFLAMLVLSRKIMEEMFPEPHPLWWIVPLFMALLPGLLEVMTAVNNDAGAVLAFTFFLWAGIRLIRHGFSLMRLFFLTLSVLICFFTKATAWAAIPLLFLVILLSLDLSSWRRVFLAIVLVALVLGAVFSFRWGDASGWYRVSPQTEPSRVRTAAASVGSYVFQVNASGFVGQTFGQLLEPALLQSLRGKTVTLGGWLSANKPVMAQLPGITILTSQGVDESAPVIVNLDTAPKYYSFTYTVPVEAIRGWVYLQPLSSSTPDTLIYLDGLVLAEGKHQSQPTFDDSSAGRGNWDGGPFTNLIRNGSAESAWLYLDPDLNAKIQNLPAPLGSASYLLASLQDVPGASWYYKETGSRLFVTFWAAAAGNKAKLPSEFTYGLLLVVTLMALVTFVFQLGDHFKRLSKPLLFFLFASVLVWGITLIRGIPELYLVVIPTVPWARYGMPAVLPVVFMLLTGLLGLFEMLQKYLHIPLRYSLLGFLAFMSSLAAFAAYGVVMYFNPRFRFELGDGGYFVIFVLFVLGSYVVLHIFRVDQQLGAD